MVERVERTDTEGIAPSGEHTEVHGGLSRNEVYNEAAAANGHLKGVFANWLKLARGVSEMRRQLLEETGLVDSDNEDARYRAAFKRFVDDHPWMKEWAPKGKSNFRSDCYWLIDNEAKVVAWHTRLPEAEQKRWASPSTVRARYKLSLELEAEENAERAARREGNQESRERRREREESGEQAERDATTRVAQARRRAEDGVDDAEDDEGGGIAYNDAGDPVIRGGTAHERLEARLDRANEALRAAYDKITWLAEENARWAEANGLLQVRIQELEQRLGIQPQPVPQLAALLPSEATASVEPKAEAPKARATPKAKAVAKPKAKAVAKTKAATKPKAGGRRTR